MIKILNFNSKYNFVLLRTLYHKSWPKDYTYESAKALENYWRPQLEKCQESYSNNKEIKENLQKKYVLSMFPYPSGRLHLGHVRVYTLNDVLARYNRLRGFYVINPIGFDSFGLPAENAAIERNIEPDVWTDSNVEYMKNQLKELSFSFDWNRELSTCKPSYYKWTQYLFLQMYLKGIVFKKEALVNWDPVDKTVLANEQIDENGKSWRSGALVEKKILKQWFIKSSAYAKSLMDSMENLSTDDWEIVKNIQKMWIGKCNGCFIDFDLEYEDKSLEKTILSVFTQSPQGVYGVSHININKHHLILNNLKKHIEENNKVPCYAINPFTKEKIPVYLKNESEFGTLNSQGIPYLDAKLAIPSLDTIDKKFAIENGLKFRDIIFDQKLINSQKFDGYNFSDAFKLACEDLLKMNRGGHITSERLSDWCISRQRYWGCPIPLVYCDKCEVVPVPLDQLPVELPKMKNNNSSLKNNNWHHTKCPNCGGPAVRETDTMDTFMDSSWYYLRYLDIENKKEPFGTEVAMKDMPVDIYIGGVEHAMTHLFVSRLICHFLYDSKKLPSKEPFKRFIAMGMVKGETFKTKNGRYVQAKNVKKISEKFYCSQTDEELTVDFEKMSKSKLNGIDPQDMIQKYGVDFTRLFLLSFVHPKSDRNFMLSSDMVNGTLGIFQKLWELVGTACYEIEKLNPHENEDSNQKLKLNNELYRVRNSQISMINYNLNENFNLPSYLVAFSKIIKFLKKYPARHYDENFYKLLAETLIIASPVIPHFTSECWSKIKNIQLLNKHFDFDKLVVEQKWPDVDSNWMLDLNLNVNGKNAMLLKINPKELEDLNLKAAIELFQNGKCLEQKLKKSLDNYEMSLMIKPFLKATLYLNEKK